MSSVIGYARVSSTEQDLALQEEALRKAGCTVVRSEKRSGTTTKGRDQLQTVLDFIHAGDVLVVTKLDRLARSVGDLMRIVELLTDKGASLRVLNAHPRARAAKPSSGCWVCSPSSKPTCVANVRWKASPRPRHEASIRAARFPSIPRLCAA
jgi:hypothetical protein